MIHEVKAFYLKWNTARSTIRLSNNVTKKMRQGGVKMNGNKMDEMKNKAVGNVEEAAGKIMDDPQLKVKGKLKQGMGKASEVADDYMHEAEDLKDTVAGTVKEKVGQLTDDSMLELKGRLQKDKVENGFPKKIMYSLGLLAIVILLMSLFEKDEFN